MFTTDNNGPYVRTSKLSKRLAPPLDRGHKAILHVKYDGQLGLHDVPRHRLHVEVADHGGRRRLQLHERHVLAEAGPGPRVERHELVRRHVPHLHHPAPVLQLRDPPLRPELPAVAAPHLLHPSHRVQRHQDLVPGPHLVPARQHVRRRRLLELLRHGRVQPQRLAQRRVQVRQPAQLVRVEARHAAAAAAALALDALQLLPYLAHHARVPRQEVEEPGQRRARRVAAGQHEVDGRVAQERVHAAFLVLVVVDVGREQVRRDLPVAVPRLLGPPLGDRVGDELVDGAPRLRHLALVPDPEPPRQLPPRHRDDVAEEEHAHGVVHGARERHLGEADGQAPGVDAEHQRRRGVERQPEEHVLEVERLPGGGHVREQREQGGVHLGAAVPRHQGPERGAGHEQLRLGALPAPRLAVGVEDAAAEDVEDLLELGALGVVGEVGGEDVADVGGVGGDEELHAGARRACEEEAELAGDQEGGDPVVEVVEVAEEGREHAHQRPVQRHERVLPLGSHVEVVEDHEAEEGEAELQEGDPRRRH
uniref:Uncharacterized protein n=1 Tax=Zea mays TaxID=4577 RepID=A0A804LDC7_MAIZE